MILPSQPPEVTNALHRAVALHQQGQLEKAAALYRAVLGQAPNYADALHYLGVLECQRRNFGAAAQLIGQALRLNPDDAVAHSNFGVALLELNQPAAALASYDRALAIKPDHAEAWHARGTVLLDLDRLDEALSSYDRALEIRPGSVEVLYARGTVLRRLGRHEVALESYDLALAIKPDYSDAWSNRGNALRKLNRREEALASYDRALAIRPDHFEALSNRGTVLLDLGRCEEAVASYGPALAAKPDHAEVLNNRGSALLALGRYEEAATDFERLLAVRPEFEYARGDLLYARLYCCDWRDHGPEVGRIADRVVAGEPVVTPFVQLSMPASPEDQHHCATRYNSRRFPVSAPAIWRGEVYRHDRIRIAYLSADFHNHATAHLMTELFETHDRERFETTALSFGPDTADAYRKRLAGAFDRFIDGREKSDRDAALLLRQHEIDIAVDLKGYTQHCRLGIFAFRPAPIQVNYLGYPGTLGAEYMDYILADRIVIPEDQRSFYTEKVVYLPDSYQPNDTKRRIGGQTPTRGEVGLPETGFVFCSFNANFKIAPPVFDVWMRLLHRVEGSVLWLFEGSAAAARNLRQSAWSRGIAPDRLIFAPLVALEDHLARHRLAGLFLDTLPCNAHTTASDALWAGLPVLTCLGTTFAGRVAASLLQAVGLPELITENLQHYEALALELALGPHSLAVIRAKLDQNRGVFPLFDAARYRRHIECAYQMMWVRHQRGEPPGSFAVPPDRDPS